MKRGKPTGALALASLATLAFIYLPLLSLIVFSFNASKFNARWTGLSLRWYVQMLGNSDMRQATLNSVIVGAASSVFSTALAAMGAVALERFPWRRKPMWEAFFFLPVVIPELMMAVGFLLLFNVFPAEMGLAKLILGHTTLNLPIVWLIIRARLKKLDPRLEEAAMDLGATRAMAFYKITLPLLAPAVLGGALMAFAISLDDFFISFFVSDFQSVTLPVYIYSLLRFNLSPEVNALSTALFVASMLLVALAFLLQGKEAHV
ncbi:MAG: ABC transporter permease [Elusimicrobia bacterium]|nr:ABC transporter permease [Elusimicrobiota bacterium]